MNPRSRRKALARTDLRAALVGVAGGVVLAAVAALVQGKLADDDRLARSQSTQARMEDPDGGGRPDDVWGRLRRLGREQRRAVAATPLTELMAWGEAWTPVEWRSWGRPAEDLSWPPASTPWECPPGAYCDPDIPPTICDADRDRWRSSTPACPFEPAPIAELPWAVGNLHGETLDETGQPLWLGCKAIEGKWHIVKIAVGPDGDGGTEDDRVRGCFGPQLGWPPEFAGGWPVDETEVRSEPVTPGVALGPRVPWLTTGPGQR